MVNREASWQVLRLYYVGGKLLGGIKNMYVDNLTFVRVKGAVNEWFRLDSGVRHDCIMFPCLFNVIWMQ